MRGARTTVAVIAALVVSTLSAVMTGPASAAPSDATWGGSFTHRFEAVDQADPWMRTWAAFTGSISTDESGEYLLTGTLTDWGYTDGSEDNVCTATFVSVEPAQFTLPLELGEWEGQLYADPNTSAANPVITVQHQCPPDPPSTLQFAWSLHMWHDCDAFVDPDPSSTWPFYALRLGPVVTDGADVSVDATTHRSCVSFDNRDISYTTTSHLSGVTVGSRTTIVMPETIRHGAGEEVVVRVRSQAGTPTGRVVLTLDGERFGAKTLLAGRAVFTLPKKLRLGAHQVRASFQGTGAFEGKDSAAQKGFAVKARSETVGHLSDGDFKPGTTVWLTLWVTAQPRTPVTGELTLRDGSKAIRTFRLLRQQDGTVRAKLPALSKGRHRISAVYSGSATVMGSRTSTATVIVR